MDLTQPKQFVFNFCPASYFSFLYHILLDDLYVLAFHCCGKISKNDKLKRKRGVFGFWISEVSGHGWSALQLCDLWWGRSIMVDRSSRRPAHGSQEAEKYVAGFLFLLFPVPLGPYLSRLCCSHSGKIPHFSLLSQRPVISGNTLTACLQVSFTHFLGVSWSSHVDNPDEHPFKFWHYCINRGTRNHTEMRTKRSVSFRIYCRVLRIVMGKKLIFFWANQRF